MTLKIISAEQIEYEGEVNLVSLPGEMGLFEVLNNHAALIASLTAGIVTYENTDGTRMKREIRGGVADINKNVVSVCIY
ncbi:MAG: F0F1 ATP synthase subunit epsilon [Muribaculaceae bacterium]|nr:F0F1 ATP synthase subunit epsilon [Muribaculaceae bacterium]MDD6019834.1 F0F1 ATP synthase subunit epsilon [bacterium]MDD6027037.1 F0F1 ATP synthase subunit epsilon [bacterium]